MKNSIIIDKIFSFSTAWYFISRISVGIVVIFFILLVCIYIRIFDSRYNVICTYSNINDKTLLADVVLRYLLFPYIQIHEELARSTYVCVYLHRMYLQDTLYTLTYNIIEYNDGSIVLLLFIAYQLHKYIHTSILYVYYCCGLYTD